MVLRKEPKVFKTQISTPRINALYLFPLVIFWRIQFASVASPFVSLSLSLFLSLSLSVSLSRHTFVSIM